MENCFLKTYKMTVADNSLEYFDALQFKVDWSDMTNKYTNLFNSVALRLGGVGVKVVILNNGEIRSSTDSAGTGVQEYIIPSNWSSLIKVIYPIDSSRQTEFLLLGLSKITSVFFVDGNIRIQLRNPLRLKECVNLQPFERSTGVFELPSIYPYEDFNGIDISDYVGNYSQKSAVTKFYGYKQLPNSSTINSCDASVFEDYANLKETSRTLGIDYGNIDSFSDLTAMTALQIGVSGSTKGVVGNITSLAKLISLSLINLNNSKVQGTIEDFAAAQYAQGRKSASRIHIYSTLVTYQGTVIGSGGKYVSWSDGGSEPTNITVTAS